MEQGDSGSLEWLGPREARGTRKPVFREGEDTKTHSAKLLEGSLESIPVGKQAQRGRVTCLRSHSQ